jgi:hypothetical protein
MNKDKIGLYKTDLKPVTVRQLINKLQDLPQDQEIVIYPKYQEVDGYKRHRFRLENVQEQSASQYKDGKVIGHYEYCAIIF